VRSSPGATSGTIDLSGDGSSIFYDDSETLDQLTLILGGANATSYLVEGASDQTLAVGATALLTQTTGTALLQANGGADTLVNDGRMVLAGGTLLEQFNIFDNAGTVTLGDNEYFSVQAMTTVFPIPARSPSARSRRWISPRR